MSDPSCHAHAHHHDIILTPSSPAGLRLALVLVVLINAGMFILEMAAGHFAFSQALLADALDFLADALTYGATLATLSAPLWLRTRVTLTKCVILVVLAVYVLASTLYQVFVQNLPDPVLMTFVGALAFMANALSVMLVYRFRNGDANIRSVWLCSRNDMIGNMAVLAAAAGVFGSGTPWPDLAIATLMCGLFTHTSVSIARQALRESRNAEQSRAQS